jgi:glutaminyl-peptide cyclotransferase
LTNSSDRTLEHLSNCLRCSASCILHALQMGGSMRSTLGIVLIGILVYCACTQSLRTSPETASFSGEKAMEYVKAQVAFGPRPPGSLQLQKCREYIEKQLSGFGYQIEDDAFTAQTPYGPINMHNLIARKGKGEKGVIVIATHYDTKLMEGKNFVGANDGGSSTGLVMELARVLADSKNAFDYWFLFLDGEEAFLEWSTFDSTYGSRHLAQRWKDEGTASRIRAFILLDMIGDRDLDIMYDTNSTDRLMKLVFDTAAGMGLQSILSKSRGDIGDDHVPFIDIGIPCVDIIDLNYGPDNSYWHTEQDSLDKISAQSLEKAGKLVLAMLPALQK